MTKNIFSSRTDLPSRRSFVKFGGMSLAALFWGNPFGKMLQGASSTARRLVVLEMNGGNDGLNTVVPFTEGKYYDYRPRLAIQPSNVLPLDGTWGLHPSLPLLKERFQAGEVAIIQGLGYPSQNCLSCLSHFEMMDYWRAGHPTGGLATGQTGWLGRLLDNLGPLTGPLAGLTISTSVGQALRGRNDLSVSAYSKEAGVLFVPEGLDETFRRALQGMADTDASDSPALRAARSGMYNSLALSDFLNQLEQPDPSYPQTYTGGQMALAARILKQNDWIRIIHIPLYLDFDTHTNQINVHANNLTEINDALNSFLKEIEAANLGDQTAVVTTSEFGRRVEDNGGEGTDHGTSNTLFVMGKRVKGGFYGEPPSLTRLDDYGNLISTLNFQDLLATVSEGWMSAPASEVVPGGRVLNIFR